MKQSSVMLDGRNRGVRVDTRSQVRQALHLLKQQAWIRDVLQSGKRRVLGRRFLFLRECDNGVGEMEETNDDN